jgi:NAD(P)-dependent dehydrogenase (short-subunit alcohol dehydrogenase family)
MSVALVTGCSTGIGYACALELARAGYRVFAGIRRPSSAGPLVEEAAAAGLPVEVVSVDVTDDRSVGDGVADVVRRAGRIDLLVNNAGITTSGVLEDLSIEEFRSVIETNLLGAVRTIKAVTPVMRRQGRGCIVNVSSQSGRAAVPVMNAYCSSKFALEGLSESVAQELHPLGIRVVVVEPGAVRTPITGKGSWPEEDGPYERVYKRMRKILKREYAEACRLQDVAEAIRKAAEDVESPFRVVVGAGARRAIDIRARTSDEVMIARHGIEDDEEFFDSWFGS